MLQIDSFVYCRCHEEIERSLVKPLYRPNITFVSFWFQMAYANGIRSGLPHDRLDEISANGARRVGLARQGHRGMRKASAGRYFRRYGRARFDHVRALCGWTRRKGEGIAPLAEAEARTRVIYGEPDCLRPVTESMHAITRPAAPGKPAYPSRKRR